MDDLRPITEDEWRKYEWMDASTFDHPEISVFIKAMAVSTQWTSVDNPLAPHMVYNDFIKGMVEAMTPKGQIR